MRHHGGIGLWLRVRAKRDRQLRVDLPGVAERAAERGQHAPDRPRVPAALRLADDQQSVEQLQALAGLGVCRRNHDDEKKWDGHPTRNPFCARSRRPRWQE